MKMRKKKNNDKNFRTITLILILIIWLNPFINQNKWEAHGIIKPLNLIITSLFSIITQDSF
jgi:hypothetical protein